MSWQRLAVSCFGATLVVMALLLIGLKVFYGDEAQTGPELEAFEVELLSPEEAARLLGVERRRSLPQRPVARPAPGPDEPPDY